MFRKFVIPYVPPVIAAAVMGTLAFNELEQHAPMQLREKMQELRPYILLGKKSTVSSPEFSGDATPQRGVFVGNDRKYTCVLVLNTSAGNNASLQERKSLTKNVAKACVDWEAKDVDLAMGLGPKVWDAVKGNVRLGNLANASAMQKSPLVTNNGGDVVVHIKADSQTTCAEVVESVLHACRHNNVNWSEDVYGYTPPATASEKQHQQQSKVCPATLHLDPADSCKIACTPNVGSSFVLYQKWENVRKKQVDTEKEQSKPSNHKSRVYGLDENGLPLRILKNTWRTGKLGTKTNEDKLGMVFVAYSVNPKIFEYMLERMQGKRGGGGEDTVLQNHKLVRSQLFFVPSRAQVRDLAL